MNGTPNVTNPAFYADELALLIAIVARMNANGWTTYGPAGVFPTVTTTTTPTGAGITTVWASSRGSDQTRHACVGLYADTTTRTFRIYGASDLDLSLLPAGPVRGVVNDDVTMTAGPPPVSAPVLMNANPATWEARLLGAQYRAFIGATPNAVNMLCSYDSSLGGRAQGFIGFGIPNPPVRHHWYFARARIQQILFVADGGLAGSGATYQIILDRDINRWLKDGRQWPNETLNYVVSAPLFQSVIGAPGHTTEGAGDATDLSMVERIPIVAGSLDYIGVFPNRVTTFRINTRASAAVPGVKLGKRGGRYDPTAGSPRGSKIANTVGDIVSVMADPTLYYCGSRRTGSAYSLEATGSMAMVGSWHPNGAQIASDSVATKRMAYMVRNETVGGGLVTATGTRSVDNDPSPGTNRSTPFVYHCFPVTNFTTFPTVSANTGVVPNTDENQKDSVGVWPDFRFFPTVAGVPNEAVGTVGGEGSQQYRIQANLGVVGFNTLGDGAGSTTTGLYVNGIRGRWA